MSGAMKILPGAAVTFDGVTKSYGAVQALKNFSLSIESGEFITILGSSGSGKSTVLNALAGFSPATEGDIFIDGRRVTHIAPEKRNIGMVFQNYSLFPHMSVLENVAFPLKMRKMNKAQRLELAEQALEVVRLSGYGDRQPKELSGGQQQRVAIARAIVFSPSLLLMDEPLGALDLKLREALQFEIKEIQHRLKCTVVYVTHDQREALAMSDRIVVLRDGQIEQVGPPTDMYDRPSSRFVADFIGQTNLLQAVMPTDSRLELPELGMAFEIPVTVREGSWYASIRPERFRRTAHKISDLCIEAQLQETIFLGDVVECTARTKDGKLIYFKEPRREGSERMARGQNVFLNFDREDIVFVEDR